MNKFKNINSYSFDKNSVEQNDIKISYLSNKHNNPLAGVEGYVRRRSSGNPLKECENSRRLSSISVHSLALAFELRRKSYSSVKSNDGEDGSHTDSTDSSLQETNQQMSFKMKCVYTFIMLMIHHNFVSFTILN